MVRDMRELEIRPRAHSYKSQYLMAGFAAVLAAGMLWAVLTGTGHEGSPLVRWAQVVFFAFLAVDSVSRVRFLKSLFFRINAEGIAWRLVVGLEILNRRPPNSSASLRWDEISSIRQGATELRITIHDKKDDLLLPLSQFNYAQRQDIKAAISAHCDVLGEQDESVNIASGTV